MKKIFLFCLLSIIPTSVLPAEIIARGKVTYIENGWNGEGIALFHTTPTEGCNAASTQYSISKNHPAYEELLSMALTAFAADSDVQLVVDAGTCEIGNRTKVISIRLMK